MIRKHLILLVAALIFNGCTIEGKEICGIWFTNGDYGKMKMEITPWNGKFFGYLLEYQENGVTIKGSKTEDHLYLTDLEFDGSEYKNGKLFVDEKVQESCVVSISFESESSFKLSGNCEVIREASKCRIAFLLKSKI